MRRLFVAGNWKMNLLGASAKQLAEGVAAAVPADEPAIDALVVLLTRIYGLWAGPLMAVVCNWGHRTFTTNLKGHLRAKFRPICSSMSGAAG